MSKSGGLQPLLVSWSSSHVRVFDPSTRQTTEGISLADACRGTAPGREMVVGVNQRNAFIRVVPVPKVSRTEVSKLLAMKLPSVMPLAPSEYVFGFRLAADGNTAIVGALRTEHLRRILDEAKSLGIKVRATLPLAFCSWLCSRERSLSECVIVESLTDSLTLDVVHKGEIWYSRSIPKPTSEDEYLDELDRTFQIADLSPVSTCAAGEFPYRSEINDSKSLIERLGDLTSIERNLFSFEMPEVARVLGDQAHRSARNRALVAATVAVIVGGYVFVSHRDIVNRAADAQQAEKDAIVQAKKTQKVALAQTKQVHDSLRILETAFKPAQQLSDVIVVLGTKSSPSSWFTGMTLERGKQILLRGDALDSKTVAKYVEELSRDPRFREMKLVFANKSTIGKKPVVQFAISGHVVGNFPIDVVPKGGPGA